MFLMRTSSNRGCNKLFETNLWEKITSFACFLESGLNCIFHWLAYWLNFCKAVLSLVTDLSKSRTFEKREVSWAKFLYIEVIPSGKSFINQK